MVATDLNRIHSQLLGDLVELNFYRVSRLRRAVSTLGPHGGLFVKRATPETCTVALHTSRFAARPCRTCSRRRSSIRSTVEIRLKVHRRDRAVVLDARLHSHQHRMRPR